MNRALCLATPLLLLGALPLMAQEEGAVPEQAAEGMKAAMGIGAVTMDGQTWTQIALRPEIPIGKLGIALDLTLYFDSDGNIRKQDWDEGKDLIEKIYYIRWGHKGDNLYLKAGALDDVTLGYGMLVRHYANTVEYPAVRRVGGEFDVKLGGPQVEGFVGNVRELDGPGLVGLRASYPVIGNLRVGASFVMDGNLYAGMADQDDDHVPDQLDRFPDHNDSDEYVLWDDLHTALGDGELWERMKESASYPGDDWLDNPLADYSKAEESLQAMGADLGYELLPNLDLYFQAASFTGYGTGWAPGVRWRPFNWLQAGAEYRNWGEQFIGDFFNRTYDVERTIFRGDSLYTREELLKDAPAMSGLYADASASLFNLITFSAAWNTMKPKDAANAVDWNSLWGDARLNLAKVPKIKELSAYYNQVGAEDLLDIKNEHAVHGLRVGYEVAPGALMRLDWRTTYTDRNGDGEIKGDAEENRTFLVETVFQLK
jgi:hypothetical protein